MRCVQKKKREAKVEIGTKRLEEGASNHTVW